VLLRPFILRLRIVIVLVPFPVFSEEAAKPAESTESIVAVSEATVPSKARNPRILELAFWGGVNFSLLRNDYTRALDGSGLASTQATYLLPSFGANAWYGSEKFQLGLSANWLSIYKYTGTSTGIGTGTFSESIGFITSQAHARYFLWRGLYAGLGAGAGLALISVDPGDGATTTRQWVFVSSARVGYGHAFSPKIVGGLFVEPTYIVQSLNQAIGGTYKDTYKNNTLNLVVGLSVAYRISL
jgi:hypothetical protein